jgi:hypothetical protein
MNEEEPESAEEINWKNGTLECWAREIKWLNPLFHHSIIPIYLLCGLCDLCG